MRLRDSVVMRQGGSVELPARILASQRPSPRGDIIDFEMRADDSFQLPLPSLSDQSGSLKLAVFDFDSTLTSFHVFASLAGCATSPNNQKLEVFPPYARSERGQISRLRALDADAHWGPGEFALQAFGGPSRVAQLHHMLKELHNRNVECVVLSNGMLGVIRDCLRRVNLSPYFSDVVANTGFSLGSTDYDYSLPFSADAPENGEYRVINKIEHLRAWMRDKRLNAHQVVCIDDESHTVGSMQSVCRTIHVASDIGIQEREIQLVSSMLQ
jgi:phosphoglycolate phosphatase-like HAD superfamily hydrolase